MMKPLVLWIALFFLCESSPSFSQASSQDEPFVTFSPKAAREIFGVGNPRRILNCRILLAQEWAYSNAQVVSFCNDAQTSCVRLALIEKALKTSSKLNKEKIKQDHDLGIEDVKLRLRGCQLAIESTVTGSSSVLEGSGLPTY